MGVDGVPRAPHTHECNNKNVNQHCQHPGEQASMPPKKKSNIDHARKLLRGVVREDSDDELGDEDLPWEWIYDGLEDLHAQGDDSPTNTSSKKRRRETKARKIIGAKIGNRFVCQIGDCLLIKGEGLSGEAYVGMACEFTEEDGEMECNVMWFSTEFEIKSKDKRIDYLPVCFSTPGYVFMLLYTDRGASMSCTSIPAGTKSHYAQLTEGPPSCRNKSTKSNTPAVSKRTLSSMARYLSAEEDVHPGLQHIRRNSSGRIYIKAERRILT